MRTTVAIPDRPDDDPRKRGRRWRDPERENARLRDELARERTWRRALEHANKELQAKVFYLSGLAQLAK